METLLSKNVDTIVSTSRIPGKHVDQLGVGGLRHDAPFTSSAETFKQNLAQAKGANREKDAGHRKANFAPI